MKNYDFYKTTMPKTRPASYYLGCLDGSVFMDFDKNEAGLIYLRRISFDGFGCCELRHEPNATLDERQSEDFRQLFEMTAKNESFQQQEKIAQLVFELISKNQARIWPDALQEHQLSPAQP